MPLKTEAISRLLDHYSPKDLANLYNHNMECQVNVAQDGGTRIDGDFKGRKWHGWTDGMTNWKSFRIPYKASTHPEYSDCPIRFDLAEHTEAIGMTGWDWANRCSRWVAFDFDAIASHAQHSKTNLTHTELEEVKETASKIPWVTIRRSTGGKGLHFYVKLDAVLTENHNEHAALSRAILGMMSAITGYDFNSKVDVCGGNMWVYHRKAIGTNGLTLIKEGEVLTDIPENWRDHIKVISGSRRKNLPQEIERNSAEDLFDELTSQRATTPLDGDHKQLIEHLREIDALWWWDQDHHMLVTHTIHLKEAYESLQLKGFFDTLSTGTEKGVDHNCFCFPLRKGAWGVRRYGLGVQEHPSWSQDGAGWTRCFLNREPDLATACSAFGGVEDPSGGFVFREAEIAAKSASLLGVHINVKSPLNSRETKLKEHKDGRLIVEIEHNPHDMADEMADWLPKKGQWRKIYNTQVSAPTEPDVGNYDDLVRHLVTETHEDCGWMLKSDGSWRAEPLTHARIALGSMGLTGKEATVILGSSVFKCWRVVNKPFQAEYPGDREWNRNASQLRYAPATNVDNLEYGTWSKLLNHCGSGLDSAVKANGWAKANGILTGGDYLKCWIASLFQSPMEPLPYLFFHGPQNSGKSIFHEAVSLLLTNGYQRADAALMSQAGFNAELQGAIVCIVEETDLRQNKQAYNRIKDWVTGRDISIHCKGKTPYHVPNSSHWIQVANDHRECPIFTGDTRITMMFVEPIDPLELIPKRIFIPLLEKEAPHFLAEVLNLELPESPDRLNIPAIETEDKRIAQKMNETQLEAFLSEHCQQAPGLSLKFGAFYDRFQEWLDPNELTYWTKIRVGKELPLQFPKARLRQTGQFHIGNICWSSTPMDERAAKGRFAVKDDYLEMVVG